MMMYRKCSLTLITIDLCFSGEFAYRKLAEKTDEDNKVGSYILRECDSNYDSYYIDVYLKSR